MNILKKLLYTVSVIVSSCVAGANVIATNGLVDDVDNAHPIVNQRPTLSQWIQAVESNQAPARTDLSGYFTTQLSMGSFASALATNTSIKELDLRDCLIGDGAARRLIKALRKNQTIESLDIRYNHVGGYFLKKLLDITLYHPTLRQVKCDDVFKLNLEEIDRIRDVPELENTVKEKIEDLFTNRAPVVRKIKIRAGELLDFDAMDDVVSFPRLEHLSAHMYMPLSTLGKFVSLVEGAPYLHTLYLGADCVDEFHEDVAENRAFGYRIVDALQRLPFLKEVVLTLNHEKESPAHVLFDPNDPVFERKLSSFLKNHSSWRRIFIATPDVKLSISRHAPEQHAKCFFTKGVLTLADMDKKSLAGLSLVARLNLMNHLSFDVSRLVRSACNRGDVRNVLEAYPLERLTIYLADDQPSDIRALGHIIDLMRRHVRSPLTLDLKMPTSVLPRVVQVVSRQVPNVTKVNFKHQKDLEKSKIYDDAAVIFERNTLFGMLFPVAQSFENL